MRKINLFRISERIEYSNTIFVNEIILPRKTGKNYNINTKKYRNYAKIQRNILNINGLLKLRRKKKRKKKLRDYGRFTVSSC